MPNTNTIADMVTKMRDMLADLEYARDAADAVADSLVLDDDRWYAATEYAEGLEDVIDALNDAANMLEEIA